MAKSDTRDPVSYKAGELPKRPPDAVAQKSKSLPGSYLTFGGLVEYLEDELQRMEALAKPDLGAQHMDAAFYSAMAVKTLLGRLRKKGEARLKQETKGGLLFIDEMIHDIKVKDLKWDESRSGEGLDVAAIMRAAAEASEADEPDGDAAGNT